MCQNTSCTPQPAQTLTQIINRSIQNYFLNEQTQFHSQEHRHVHVQIQIPRKIV